MLVTLDSISPETTTQARHGSDTALVEEYAAAMRDGGKFPAVAIFRDVDGTLRIGDGFHRVTAAGIAGLESIEAEIHEGDARAALAYSIQSNSRHGARFTNRDKRRIVGIMLDDPEWSQLSDREIGRRCGVSQPFVGKVRADRGDNGYQPTTRLTPEDSAKLTECEATLSRLLPTMIFGNLPIGSLDTATVYEGMDTERRILSRVSHSDHSGYWHVSVVDLDGRTVTEMKRPVCENAIPVALQVCGYVSDDSLWAMTMATD